MTDYTKTTDFLVKDGYLPGNPGKIIKGSEFDTEFDNIETAVNSKADTLDATFTGTLTAQALNVNGTVTVTDVTPILQITGANTGSCVINFGDAADNNVGRIFYDHTDNYMQLKTNDAERMRIDSSGNVGIGTASPATALDVVGTATMNGLTVAQNGATVITLGESGGSDSTRLVLGKGFDSASSIEFDRANGNIDAKIEVDSAEQLNIHYNFSDTGASLNLRTGSTGTEVMVLDSTGNVGIGTDTPTSRLSVFGSGGVPIRWGNTTSLGTLTYAGSDPIIQSNTGNTLFYQSGSESMRINSAGNVGIGTTTPQAVLDLGNGTVGRGLCWGNTATAVYSNMWSSFSGGRTVIGNGYKGSTTLSNGYESSVSASWAKSAVALGAGIVQFFTDAATTVDYGTAVTPTERMRIDSTGHAIIPAGVTLGTAAGVYAAANTLDDYEEGTWTPEFGGTTGTASISFSATYTKIGDTVHAFCWLNGVDLSADTITGDVFIRGLPFAIASNNQMSVSVANQDVSTTYLNISGRITTSVIRLQQNTTTAPLVRTDLVSAASKVIMVGVTYKTAA